MNRIKPLPSDAVMPTHPDVHRLERERRLIEEARASVADGHLVPDEDVDAWLDHMVESEEPMPIPGERHSARSKG